MRFTMLMMIGCGRVALLEASDCGVDCPVCETDTECVVVHNPCSEIAVCGHVDEDLAVTQIGCGSVQEYRTPTTERCTCVNEVCGI